MKLINKWHLNPLWGSKVQFKCLFCIWLNRFMLKNQTMHNCRPVCYRKKKTCIFLTSKWTPPKGWEDLKNRDAIKTAVFFFLDQSFTACIEMSWFRRDFVSNYYIYFQNSTTWTSNQGASFQGYTSFFQFSVLCALAVCVCVGTVVRRINKKISSK